MPARIASSTENVDLVAEEEGNERRMGRDEVPSDAKRRLHREASRRGGLKGGPARAARLTPKQRSEIASKAAKARWAKGRRRSA
jgi:hypothetical protein